MVYLLFFCTHYPVRGGSSIASANGGAFSVGTNNTASNTYWNYGVALSVYTLYSSWWSFY